MRTKLLSLFVLTALVLTISFTLAAGVNPSVSSVTLNEGTTSSSFTADASSTGSFVGSLVDDAGANIIPTISGTGNITITQANNINYDNLQLGKLYQGSINVSNATESSIVSFQYIHTLCDDGPLNSSVLEITVDINNRGEGDDDDWLPLDEIEIEVEVDNEGNEDLDDIMVEFALIEKDSGKDVTSDLIWISKDDEEADLGDIDEGKDETHTFIFKVDTELGLDENDYLIMVKAFPDGDEDEICTDSSNDLDDTYFEEINIDRENDDDRLVIIEDIQADTVPLICGQEAIIIAKAYNIGEDDQDKVLVDLTSKGLNIDLFIVLDNFDADDGAKTLEFSFFVPENVTADLYKFDFQTFYDWDDDLDPDLTSSYDENSQLFTWKFDVEGKCLGSVITGSKISATLSEDTPKAVTGRELIIETIVENTGTEDTEYTLSISGLSGWAKVSAIDPETFTLAPGDTKDVTVYLDVDKDTKAGEKEFTLKTTYGSESTEQKVLVDVEEGFAGFALVDNVKNNWFIYLIILINVILIVAIILAVKGMAAKRAA